MRKDFDFAAARRFPALPDDTPRVTYRERSTQYGELLWEATDLLRLTRSDALTATARDFGERRQVELVLYAGSEPFLSATMNEDRRTLVKPAAGFFDTRDFVENLRRNRLVSQDRVYEDRFWAKDAAFLREGAFLDEVAEALRAVVVPDTACAPR